MSFDINAFNLLIAEGARPLRMDPNDVDEDGRPTALPCLDLPNDAQVYAYAKPTDEGPMFQVSVHFDGDWDDAFRDHKGGIRTCVTIGDTDFFDSRAHYPQLTEAERNQIDGLRALMRQRDESHAMFQDDNGETLDQEGHDAASAEYEYQLNQNSHPESMLEIIERLTGYTGASESAEEIES